MTTFITTPAAQVAEALGIHPDPRVRLDITSTGWDNATCEETGAPGAVEVRWLTRDYEDGGWQITDRTLAADIAGDYINALLLNDATSPDETIHVMVAHQWVRFVHPELADIARYVYGPARIAA